MLYVLSLMNCVQYPSLNLLVQDNASSSDTLPRSPPVPWFKGSILCNTAKVDTEQHADLVLSYKNRLPQLSLANGLCLGDVPLKTCQLNFTEKILIACYCHNCCIVRRVHKGGYKPHANTGICSTCCTATDCTTNAQV